jgi:hypothetical protein
MVPKTQRTRTPFVHLRCLLSTKTVQRTQHTRTILEPLRRSMAMTMVPKTGHIPTTFARRRNPTVMTIAHTPTSVDRHRVCLNKFVQCGWNVCRLSSINALPNTYNNLGNTTMSRTLFFPFGYSHIKTFNIDSTIMSTKLCS